LNQNKGLWARVTPYLYILPTMAFIVLVFLYPTLELIRRSFLVADASGVLSFGLANFRNTFNDPVFWQALHNNLRLLLAVPILVFLSLIISTVLYERIRGWRVYRTIIFVPYIISVPVVGIVFTYLLGLRGVINSLLRATGMGILAQDWLGNPQLAIYTIMGIVIWKELGFGIVLFLARLMSVDEELYEAARLDGANWWQLMRNITVPQLATVIEFYVLLNMINMLSWMFNYVYIMTRGGPGFSTHVLDFFIYQNAFRFSQLGIAAAISLLLLVIGSGLVIGQAFFRRRLEEAE
jgi:ABC-type sugar transport system permease subunit